MTARSNSVFWGLRDIGAGFGLEAVYSKVNVYRYRHLGKHVPVTNGVRIVGGGGTDSGLAYTIGAEASDTENSDVQVLTTQTVYQHHSISGAQRRDWAHPAGDDTPNESDLTNVIWPRVLFPSLGVLWEPDPSVGIHLIRAGTEYWPPMEDQYGGAIPFKLIPIDNDLENSDIDQWGLKTSADGDGFYVGLNDWFQDTAYIAHVAFTLTGGNIKVGLKDSLRSIGLKYVYGDPCTLTIYFDSGSGITIEGLLAANFGPTVGLTIIFDNVSGLWHVLVNGNHVYQLDYTTLALAGESDAYDIYGDFGPPGDKAVPFFITRFDIEGEGEATFHQVHIAGKEKLATPGKAYQNISPEGPDKVDAAMYPGKIPGLGSVPANRENQVVQIYSKWDGLNDEIGLGANINLGAPTITFPRPS